MSRKKEIISAHRLSNIIKNHDSQIGFIAGATWADEHPISVWISAKNQLPTRLPNDIASNFVLCRLTNSTYDVLRYIYPYEVWENQYDVMFEEDEITHWMFIPNIN